MAVSMNTDLSLMYGSYNTNYTENSDDKANAMFIKLPGTAGVTQETSQTADTNNQDTEDNAGNGREKAGYKSSPEDCETCKHRKYVDGSNESDVSFKAPAHISPGASYGAVMSHEMEHVGNAKQAASKPGAQLVSVSVSLTMAVCPECGTRYVSGGTTNSSIKYTSNPYDSARKTVEGSYLSGMNMDEKA